MTNLFVQCNYLYIIFVIIKCQKPYMYKMYVFISMCLYAYKLPFESIDMTEKQNLENAQMKREKASLENELLKTQVSNESSVG